MNEIKFNELVSKEYIWKNGTYAIVAKLMPLNDWERWSFRAGKNSKVRVSVGERDFVNVSVRLVDLAGKKDIAYKFVWMSFSTFRDFNEEYYAVKNPITGCDPKDWWKNREALAVLSVVDNLLEDTLYFRMRECGGVESAEFTKKSI